MQERRVMLITHGYQEFVGTPIDGYGGDDPNNHWAAFTAAAKIRQRHCAIAVCTTGITNNPTIGEVVALKIKANLANSHEIPVLTHGSHRPANTTISELTTARTILQTNYPDIKHVVCLARFRHLRRVRQDAARVLTPYGLTTSFISHEVVIQHCKDAGSICPADWDRYTQWKHSPQVAMLDRREDFMAAIDSSSLGFAALQLIDKRMDWFRSAVYPKLLR